VLRRYIERRTAPSLPDHGPENEGSRMSVPLPVRLLGAATAGFEQGPPAQGLGDPREERPRHVLSRIHA
jgi:hypothetical protein